MIKMISSEPLVTKIKTRFASTHERNSRVFINILLSFFYRGLNILIQLALIPLTINYLNKDQYGIWLTLSAIIGWVSFFDIGLGNGLRNKLAEALANTNFDLARSYISTSYAILFITFISIIIIFLLLNPFLKWSLILNAPASLDAELSRLALVAFSFFCLRFIFSVLTNILFAVQRPALNNLITMLGSLISFLSIYFLKYSTKPSLFLVGSIFSAIPVIILIGWSVMLFYGKLKYLRPRIRYADFKLIPSLMGLGYRFFIIQIAGILLFSCSEIIITQLFGPAEVTIYNVAFRYFTVLTMIYSIIMTPFWSAFTDAYTRNDLGWINSAIKKLNRISQFFAAVGILMILFSDRIYFLWLHGSVEVPKSVSITMGIFVIFSVIASPYNTFINGVGKIKLQFYLAVFSIIITIPLALLFAKYLHWGTAGVIVASLCVTIPCTVLWKIQVNKIIRNKAVGIWNK